MSTNIFRGDANAVAQVVTIQITADDAATTYIVTIGGKAVSVLGSGVNAATTAGALYLALIADTSAEFAEVTWTVTDPLTDTITGTAVTAGKPFTAVSSKSGGAGTIGAVTTTTTSTGPNDLSTLANWSLGVLPVNADDVIFTNTSTDVLWNLGTLSAVTLTSLTFTSTYTGKIGLTDFNSTGNYYEYRTKYFTIKATTVNVGDQVLGGNGSGRIKLALGAAASTINMVGTGTPFDSGLPALIVNGSGSSYTLNLLQGTIGVALDSGSSATLPTIRVGYENAPASDVTLTLGSGCTITTISQYGGTILTSASVTTWTMTSGVGTAIGAAAITTLNMFPAADQSSTMYHEANGTIGTLTLGPAATINFERDLRSRTVTDSTLYSGSALLDGFRTVTFTNPSTFKGELSTIKIRRGSAFTMQL